MPTTMRAIQIPRPHGDFEIEERPVPEPGPGMSRVKVQASGICGSDELVKEGMWPGLTYPRVPGHEVIGVVDAVGAGVKGWKEGERAGVGWNGGYCGYCEACRRGLFLACVNGPFITGVLTDGGYADYVVSRWEALAHVPDELNAVEGAPLMCAGVTTFNCLRNAGARPGDVVAVIGLGGLGHLAVQYAAKMGLRTVAIGRGGDKEELARKLGADHYLDSAANDPSAELKKLGGAKAVLATVASGEAMASVLGGLAVDGSLMVIGAAAQMTFMPAMLLTGRNAIKGWYSGMSADSEDTLRFSVKSCVRPMTESYPLEKVAEGYERMKSGKARFRVVLTTGN
jgi:alcohol dehydrogenase